MKAPPEKRRGGEGGSTAVDELPGRGPWPWRLRPRPNLYRLALIPLAMIIGGVTGTLVAGSRPKVYEAGARIALDRGVRDVIFDNGATAPLSAQAEALVVESAAVKASVREKLGREPPVSVFPVLATDILEVQTRAATPEQAASWANAYADSYVEYRKSRAIDDVRTTEQELQRKIDDLQREIDDLTSRGTSGSAEERLVFEQNFGVRRNALISEQGVLRQQVDQLRIAAALRTGGARVLSPAVAPTSPVEPKPLQGGAVGLSAGLFVALALNLVAGGRRGR